MKKRKLQFDFWTVVTIGIIAVFALFLIYPLISLFIDGFLKEGTGEFTMANFQKFFGKKFYYRSLLNSLKLTVCVTICSLVIGVPLAYFMSFYKIRGKGIVEILIIISMMSPNFIGAYSWILLLGRSGVITTFLSNVFGIKMPSIYGFGGMLLVFTLKLYPFIYMYVSGALKKIDVAVCEAAESLGCYGIRKVFTVVMPLVMPTAIASALLVFMNCMADFGTPALIGEGFDVLPTKIYIEFVGESGGLLCLGDGVHHGGHHSGAVPDAEMVCEQKELYNERHAAHSARTGARRQECADARVHIHPRRVLRAAASGDCLDVVPKDGDPVFRGRLFA